MQNIIILIPLVAANLEYSSRSPGVVETDASQQLDREVEGGATEQLRATRRGDAGRDITHFDGVSWAPFLTDAFPIEMHATSNGTDTLVCAPVATSFPSTAEVLTECGIRGPSGFPAADRVRFAGAPGSFVRDVCPDPEGFDVLVLQASNPFGVPELPGGPIPEGCVEFRWTPAQGWQESDHGVTCSCDVREGEPCDNPCYAGSAHWEDGACVADDTSGFLCDDGDPLTIDHCSGVTTRCTPDHPDFARTMVMDVPVIAADGRVTRAASEIPCPLGQDNCYCSCLPGDAGCETLTDVDDLVDAMCSYVEIDPFIGVFERGDMNGDGLVDVSDASYLFTAMFLGGPAIQCDDAADVDDNGDIDLTDGIYLLNFLFNEGPAPAEPSTVVC